MEEGIRAHNPSLESGSNKRNQKSKSGRVDPILLTAWSADTFFVLN